MNKFTLRLIDGCNLDLLDEVADENFYINGDIEFSYSIDVCNYGIDILFNIANENALGDFSYALEKTAVVLYDNRGYDWWDNYDNSRKIVIYKCDDSLIVKSA